MATKTFHLEIRVTTNDDFTIDTVKEVMKRSARELFAITSVAKGEGGPAPVIHLYAEDWIVGKEDIDVQPGVTGPSSQEDEAIGNVVL